jgi:hypothetical protein
MNEAHTRGNKRFQQLKTQVPKCLHFPVLGVQKLLTRCTRILSCVSRSLFLLLLLSVFATSLPPILIFFFFFDGYLCKFSFCLCKSGTTGDHPSCVSKTSVPLVLPLSAETVDSLHKYQREPL